VCRYKAFRAVSRTHPACFRDGSRFVQALLVGTMVSVLLAKALRLQEAFPVGFLAAIVFDQTRFFVEAFRINAQQTREIFGRWLPSRALLLERTVIFTFISVGLLSLCVRDVHSATSMLPQDWRTFIYFAALFAVWLQMHNGFGIYYAKKYFTLNPAPSADGPDPQGFVFAGSDEPEFTDFLYVSYAVGLTYAMSDTNLEDSSIRRVVLFHSVVSFLFYSTVISAVINLFTSG
jgi:uncharacterized membrane protein